MNSKKTILGKSLDQWKREYPLVEEIVNLQEVFWANPKYNSTSEIIKSLPLKMEDVYDADRRLKRFAPYIAKAFPETETSNGIIESETKRIPQMEKYLEQAFKQELPGELLLKCDSHLAVSGSIKARGGIYEVLKHAETLAIGHGMLKEEDNYAVLDNDDFRKFYSQYAIAVGSTGNLGLSIGIIGAKLGFNVTVHMSADAKEWKKRLLRSKGVSVIEYESDYSMAVTEGRKQSENNPYCYFIDDENSKDLFLGYAVAALRLKKQLEEMDIIVDQDHPIFVYLPCGVGGGPGGINFGLKLVYGSNVHCFLAEPTHSPSMLIGCMTGEHNRVSVQDFGIDNITEADGLAVGRASGFVGKTVENILSGIYTVEDSTLNRLLAAMADTENIFLEPSALAGVMGIVELFKTASGQNYLRDHSLKDRMLHAAHIIWATGGSMVPEKEMLEYYRKGREHSLFKQVP